MAVSSCSELQLALDLTRKPTGRGGWRPNAGRPKGRRKISHDAREDFARTKPVFVTLRVATGLPSLRRGDIVKTLWGALAAAHREDFRAVHFVVEDDHLHLVLEAHGARACARGLQRIEVRFAKQLNKLLGRSGKVFHERYHVRVLASPREVRNALRYVLNNTRHHVWERGHALDASWIDPYSSAIWFDGWRDALVIDQPWKRDLLAMIPPVARPTVWLLTTGWRKHGPLAFDEIPGIR